MRWPRSGWVLLAALGAVTTSLSLTAPARADFGDPLFLYVPAAPKVPPPAPLLPKPPPTGYFNGPCGLGVDPSGNFYVSDYYHHAVDVFQPNSSGYKNPSEDPSGYITQLANEDPADGPCGLSFDAAGGLYVNNYHRNVVRFGFSPAFGAGTAITGAPVDSTHPTGVAVDPISGNVYVDQRTYIAVFDSADQPVLDGGGEPLQIGLGSLEDGYGVAFSQFPGTLGRLYVPDAGDDTVKVYDPAVDTVDPVAVIAGEDTPAGEFVSLRDAAVAVDRISGDVYVADNLQPLHTERPQATIHVFDAAGEYEGHLKYKVVDALPPGLAVDNSTGPTQGRVYVTTGNTTKAGVYAYPPGAAVVDPPIPTALTLAPSPGATGAGSIESAVPDVGCPAPCEGGSSSDAQPEALRHRNGHRRLRHRGFSIGQATRAKGRHS